MSVMIGFSMGLFVKLIWGVLNLWNLRTWVIGQTWGVNFCQYLFEYSLVSLPLFFSWDCDDSSGNRLPTDPGVHSFLFPFYPTFSVFSEILY